MVRVGEFKGILDEFRATQLVAIGSMFASGGFVSLSGFTATTGNILASSGNITATQGNIIIPGSQFGIVVNIPASVGITGGQFVDIISGTTTTVMPAGSNSALTIGVCTTTIVSGALCPVALTGIFQMKAEANITAGDLVRPGINNSAGTVTNLGSPFTAQQEMARIWGKALNSAASGGTVLIVSYA